jgi:hypothetical protein
MTSEIIEIARKFSEMKKNEMHLKAEYLALADTYRMVNRMSPHSTEARLAYDDMKIARGEWESARDNLLSEINKSRGQ